MLLKRRTSYSMNPFYSLTCIIFLLLIAANTFPQSVSTKSVTITGDVPWVVAADEPEALQRALEDVQTDWYKVFGHTPIILSEPPADWKGPLIYLGMKGTWMKGLVKKTFPGPESFSLSMQQDNNARAALVATGADLRGSIYAAYALSEEILGVDPWYYWVDKEPARQNSIQVPSDYQKDYGTPTFKYRGWFINDEDLSNIFAADPLRENVFSLAWFNRIYETLLRLKGNMVVPATFLFPDERCQELAARRGLILNMHHILVLGLNTYRWPKDVPFSYNKYPKIMERYWQTCIDAFKDYETVWTVGYRGKHDRPFWTDEPELKTPEERGAAITKAIAKQVEMVRKVHPDAPIIANMWMEGADMLQQGYIKLPKGVTIVWPDAGDGMIRDGGKVQAGQGIYYHTAMLSGRQNQLSEMVNPGRIYNQIGRFVKAGATEFFLVNVSDIRPVPLSTDCVMKLVWDAKPYVDKTDEQNMGAFLHDWSQREFGTELADQIAAVYKQYFAIPYMRDDKNNVAKYAEWYINRENNPSLSEDVLKGENWIHTRIRNLDKLVAPLIADGKKLTDEARKMSEDNLSFSSTAKAYVVDLMDKARLIVPQLPADRIQFYQSHVITQIQIHLQSLSILESYCEAALAYQAGNKMESILQSGVAMQACHDLFFALHQAEYGKWAGWYQGECFVNLNGTYDLTRVLAARLKGEPIPPVRTGRTYADLYKYQEVFEKNFPLLYPVGK